MLFRKLFLLAVNARSFEDLCCGPIFGPVLGVFFFFLYFRWKLWPIGGLSSGGLLADTHTPNTGLRWCCHTVLCWSFSISYGSVFGQKISGGGFEKITQVDSMCGSVACYGTGDLRNWSRFSGHTYKLVDFFWWKREMLCLYMDEECLSSIITNQTVY